MKNTRKKQVTSHKQKGCNYARANLGPLCQEFNNAACAHIVCLDAIRMHVHPSYGLPTWAVLGAAGDSPSEITAPQSQPHPEVNLIRSWHEVGQCVTRQVVAKITCSPIADREQTDCRAAVCLRHVHTSAALDCLLLSRVFWCRKLVTIRSGSA